LGEGIDDLRDFDPSVFVKALFDRSKTEAETEPPVEKKTGLQFFEK